MPPASLCLHRVLEAPSQQLVRALTEAASPCRWLPPHGFTAKRQHLAVRAGGGCRMSFTHSGSGQPVKPGTPNG